jgi:hypothetical protein
LKSIGAPLISSFLHSAIVIFGLSFSSLPRVVAWLFHFFISFFAVRAIVVVDYLETLQFPIDSTFIDDP